MISLQLSICGSPKDVFQVQINLEGSEGTVVFPVKHQCQHRYGHKWYYSAFTDRFIGEPKKFYFMVCLLRIMHESSRNNYCFNLSLDMMNVSLTMLCSLWNSKVFFNTCKHFNVKFKHWVLFLLCN